MSDPDPPLPLKSHQTTPHVDARARRTAFGIGAAIGALVSFAATALLLSAWSATDSEFSHGLTPLHDGKARLAESSAPTASAPSIAAPTTLPASRSAPAARQTDPGAAPASQPVFPRVSQTPGTVRHTISVGSTLREFWLHTPQSISGNFSTSQPRRSDRRPAVIVLHGARGNGVVAELYTGFSALADREDFLVAYPNATGEPSRWAAGRTGTGAVIPTDITFIEKLIATLVEDYGADPHRVYLCGHSSGGFMTYQFAGAKPELIAAAGVSAGSIGGLTSDGRPMFMIAPPRQPVPLMVFHGRKDNAIPYDESVAPGPGHDKVVSVADTVAYWVNLNRAFPVPQRSTQFSGGAIVDAYRAMPGGAPVILYTLPEGVHQWPGDATAAATRKRRGEAPTPNDQVEATRLLWDFFKAHSRP